ncbi:MAG: repair protein SbcD/Mre11, partial [Actinomycetota bacterium]|nr:repair protein SbcD/Mre11 [Actinomycetota bacterium]
GTLAQLEGLADTVGDAYLRVFLKERFRAGLGDEVREILPNAVKVIIETPDAPLGATKKRRIGTAATPRELFAEYLSERNSEDERMLQLFDSLYEESHATDAT